MNPDQPATSFAIMGAILDVDGVLLAWPHERAWREALQGRTGQLGEERK